MEQFFQVALRFRRKRSASCEATDFYLRPDQDFNKAALPAGIWLATSHESAAHAFGTREAAESVMLLDAARHPDRIGCYQIITVTKVVGSVVRKTL